MASFSGVSFSPSSQIGVIRVLTPEFLQYRQRAMRNHHSDSEEVRWQSSAQSEQLSKPRPLHENTSLAPLNPSPCPPTVTDHPRSITAHPSHSSHGKFESSTSNQSVAFIDSIKITFTSQPNTLHTSRSFSESHSRNGSTKRLITPRTGDRRSKTPPNQDEQKSHKKEEIEIIELEAVERKETKEACTDDGKAKRPAKNEMRVMAKTSDRRSKASPRHNKQKTEEIEIIELETVKPKETKRASSGDVKTKETKRASSGDVKETKRGSSGDVKAKRSPKHEMEDISDDLRVVVFRVDQETVCARAIKNIL